jgi:hypothetical protein
MANGALKTEAAVFSQKVAKATKGGDRKRAKGFAPGRGTGPVCFRTTGFESHLKTTTDIKCPVTVGRAAGEILGPLDADGQLI